MEWAARRRRFILVVVALMGSALLALVLIATFYKTPTCSDGTQNGTETGIDCGGSCARICTVDVSAPSVRFVRPLFEQGRTDVVTYIDNANTGAAVKGAPFTITLYDGSNAVLVRVPGTVDLPPASTIPVFVPGAYLGNTKVARAFLTFDDPANLVWYHFTETLPKLSVHDIVFTGGDTPRLTGTLANPEVRSIANIPVVATIFDAANTVIAASATVVSLPANGSAPLVFTWSAPLPDTPARYEILPRVPF